MQVSWWEEDYGLRDVLGTSPTLLTFKDFKVILPSDWELHVCTG